VCDAAHFHLFSGEVVIRGALGVRVDKEVVVVEGGEREDGGVVWWLMADMMTCTRGCTMNTCISLSGNAEKGLKEC
jgi:hypothetical protein